MNWIFPIELRRKLPSLRWKGAGGGGVVVVAIIAASSQVLITRVRDVYR